MIPHILVQAVFGNLVTFVVMAWCIVKKGPVFVATFKPLGIAIAALLGVFFLGDTLHVGRSVLCSYQALRFHSMFGIEP
uniref:WAT1-related protein At3g28050-like isoform X1 n=1 Tax=Rhizophora mucronata TaxID=61149 RepID=A0A2P2KA21_RHIMU